MIQEQKLFYRLWVELRIAGSISPGSIGSQFNPFLPLGSKVRCSNTCYYIRVFSTKGTFVIVIVIVVVAIDAPLFPSLNNGELGNRSVARLSNANLWYRWGSGRGRRWCLRHYLRLCLRRYSWPYRRHMRWWWSR